MTARLDTAIATAIAAVDALAAEAAAADRRDIQTAASSAVLRLHDARRDYKRIAIHLP